MHTVLLIDEEAVYIETMKAVLETCNCSIQIAPNAVDGIQIAKESYPTLIIIAWKTNEKPDIDTIKHFKSIERLRVVPILLLANYIVNFEDLRNALDAGADDYILKPIDKVELNSRIRSMIRLNESLKQIGQLKKEIDKQKAEALKLESEEQIKNNIYSILQKVDKKFYNKIELKFPELTKKERQIAAFCKLNMSVKDIVELTSRTEISIKKARQRLRRKLNINPQIRLNDFFEKL